MFDFFIIMFECIYDYLTEWIGKEHCDWTYGIKFILRIKQMQNIINYT